MTGKLILGLLLATMIAGCGRVAESRFNPINWFGNSRAAQTTAAVAQQATPLVGQVVTLRVERVPSGAIVRATGLNPRQGYYDGELIPENDEKPVDGVLSYQFKATPPFGATASGPPRSREVVVGRFVSEQTLEGVRQIRVSATSNALVVRR